MWRQPMVLATGSILPFSVAARSGLMKITLKLFAGLSEYLPASAVRNAIVLEVGESCSLNDLIDQHRIPRDLVHLVLINGTSRQESERDDPILNGGDAVAMWPPVAGG